MELLFRLRESGSMPGISRTLGKHVRTNSESIIGARVPQCADDLSQGIAIGSGIYIDEHTHIEAVRYPNGSDVMGLLTTMLTDGQPGPRRIGLWAKNIVSSLIMGEKHREFPALSSHADSAAFSPVGMGTRVHHPAVHASARRAHRNAMATALVLAISQDAVQLRGQGSYVYSDSESVRSEVRSNRRRHRNEHAPRDPF
jgi:hypothetical protein